jgi:2-polyprenyl-6-methoxyphenol hydroxylase-like FAD-dependent oxidoreductase
MNTSVLIVGAGPVGLTLACELTRYRIPVRIVDKAAQRNITPSARREDDPPSRLGTTAREERSFTSAANEG